MDWSTIWVAIATALSGTVISSLIAGAIVASVKGVFTNAINKINTKKIENDAVDKAVDKIQTITFNQSIQPVVESELQKINEKSNEYIDACLKETRDNYNKLVDVVEALANYFNYSVGVPDEAKELLAEAIKLARGEQKTEDVKTEIKVEVKADNKTAEIVENTVER